MSVPVASSGEALRTFLDASRLRPSEPYRSLEPFRFADTGLLAARDREVERLIRLITMYRGVLFYGESGAGKTSVLNAGLLPRLIDEGYWPHRVRVRPQRGKEFTLEPIRCSDHEGEAFLPSAFPGASEDEQTVIAADDLVPAVDAATDHGPIVLVFDQFEELVTLFQRGPEAAASQSTIISTIASLLRGGAVDHLEEPRPMVRVKLLFAFREDYLASLAPLFEQHPELLHQSLRLLAPPQERAVEIIRAPFERFPNEYPQELSPQLAERIATSLALHGDGKSVPLSELQIVCRRLSHAPDPSRLLAERDINGILEDHTEEALQRFPGNLRDAAIAVLAEMITSGNTRNVVAASDLVQRAGAEHEELDPRLLNEAVRRLDAESGLIQLERRRDLDLYELKSEFLIPWISQQRDQLEADRARRRQERRVRRLRWIIAAVVAVLAGFIALAIVAIHQAQTARHQRAAATDLELSSTAQALLSIRPDASLILALAAYHNNPSLPDVRTSMIASLEEAQRAGAYGILHGSTNSVTSVAFNPRTGLLASGSADGTIRLWSTRTRRQVGEMRGLTPGGVFSVAFAPDGRALASGGQDGSVRLWDVASGRALGSPIPVQSRIIISVEFSPNGRELAAAGLDAGIDLVKIARDRTVGSPLPLVGSKAVRSVAFSPDSQTLASAGNNRRIELWDVATRTLLKPRFVAGSALYTVVFNPNLNEDQVAAGGLNGHLYLWTPTGRRSAPLGTGPAPAIDSIAFSRDGTTLAAGKADDSVQLWNLDTRGPSGPPLTGHEGIVTSVAFSSDGHTLASGSTDRTIRLWRIPSSNAFGSAVAPNVRRVNGIAFSPADRKFIAVGPRGITVWPVANGIPSGRGVTVANSVSARSVATDPQNGVLATGSEGGSMQLWRTSGAAVGPAVRDNPRKSIYTVAFSPNGRLLAFAGQNGIITVRNLTSGKQSELQPQSGRVFSLAFSPDSQILASGGDDRTIRLWSVSSDRQIAQLTGDSDAVFSLAFSSNGILASGSADDTIRLWNVRTDEEIGQPLMGDHGYVRSVAFTPGGDILASGSSDRTIRFWDVASRTQIGQPLISSSGIETVAFSPTGGELVAGGDDGDVRVWPLSVLPGSYNTLRNAVCSITGVGLSRAEWSQFAPMAGYFDPCS